MSQTEIFSCDLSKYLLEFIIYSESNKKIAYLNTILYDYNPDTKNINLWFSLIRRAIDKLTDLKIDLIIQTVTTQDYNNFLKNKTGFKIYKTNNQDICDIFCPLNKFLDYFSIGLGLV